MLQKITAAWDSTEHLHEAMSIFGGHGVIEDFSSLPRLYRDSAVNELWEGPRNVLLTQIYRDLTRVMDWYDPAEFVANILRGAEQAVVEKLASQIGIVKEIGNLTKYQGAYGMNADAVAAWRRWDLFCADLFHAYQDLALVEVEKGTERIDVETKISAGEAAVPEIERVA